MHHRQVGGHVQISPGRNLVTELHLYIRQHLDGGGVAGAGLVAGGDRTDHVAIAFAHIVRAEILQLFGALCQGRRSLALVGERGKYQPVDALGGHHGIGAGAQRARGFAEEMEFLPAGFAGNDFNRRLQILDAAGDVGIAGSTPGLAVIFVIHGPAVEAIAGEFIHHRIFAMAGHVEVERPRAD